MNQSPSNVTLSLEDRLHRVRRALALIAASATVDPDMLPVTRQDVVDGIQGTVADALELLEAMHHAPAAVLNWTPVEAEPERP